LKYDKNLRAKAIFSPFRANQGVKNYFLFPLFAIVEKTKACVRHDRGATSFNYADSGHTPREA
jgi:hypothetical protein